MAGFVDFSAAQEGRLFDPSNEKNYEDLESRLSILKDVVDGLKNPDVSMVGLYGVGGIGKTTLAMKVFEQVMIEKIFDEAVFAQVSSDPNVKMIQGEIADQLDLELSEGAESERGRTLSNRLMKEKKILVILDDVWTSLDLETIGIPFGYVHRGCKILLTSRSRDVLVHGMHSQYNYCVSALNQEEAWILFTKVAGDCIKERKLRSIANQLAKECGGLPIAVVTVAKALKNKSLVDWKYALNELKLLVDWRNALQELRSSAGECKGSDALVHSSIELSFNFLIDQEVKSAFMVCGLMKRPYNSPIMDLLKYGMGLGLYEGTNSMQERRDRIHSLVDQLKGSSLLLDGHAKDSFSMHDIVHNVAVSIASREHVFWVRNTVPVAWLNKNILKKCSAISLYNINNEELRQGLECPELTFFCLNPKDPFFKISDNFFTGITKLTALVLTKMHLLSLPLSIHHLQNLETLCLEECILRDVDIIGNLKKLKMLSFHRSHIEQLPMEISQLSQLELLDLSHCSKLKVIPQNVISSFSRLEELYMGNTSVEWELEGLNVGRSNASVLELKHLSQLTSLEIHIRDAVILPKELFSTKLERYKIFIGDEWDWSAKYENKRILKLQLHTSICLDNVIMLLEGIEELYLDEVPSIRNVLYDLDKVGFPQLKHLHVQNNPFISCILDSAVLVHLDAFPLLETMVLHNLIRLEKICHGQLTAESFRNLKMVKVRNCCKLKNIFSLSIAGGLPGLQTIEVIKCKNVAEIFTVGTEDDVDDDEPNEIDLGELCTLTLKFLPQLTNFYSSVKMPAKWQNRHKDLTSHIQPSEVVLGDELDTTAPFFNGKVVFPKLVSLELCAINTPKLWHNQLAVVSSCFQNLTRLIVHSCDRLKYFFTSSIVSNFAQLQHLEICYCMALEEIVAKEREAEAATKFSFPRVTFLKLLSLSELRAFYPGMHTTEWPSLKKLEVYGCDKVNILTSKLLSFHGSSEEGKLKIPAQQSLFVVEAVPSLEELKLSGKDITMICQGQFPKHLFQKLKILEVVNDKSENFQIGFLQKFHNLEKLELRSSSYKEIFSHGEVEQHAGTLTKIKSLKLWELPDLMHIWKQDSELDLVIQNLEMLEVWWCDNLIDLVPSSVSFKNLTTLEVWCCKGLKNLVTPSMAKSLVCLRKLRVDGCKLMTEVISNEGDAAEDEIVFTKLKWLSLERLESLTSFCSGNYTFKFPALEDLFVIECPKMKIFTRRVSSTPMLQEVRQKWGLEKGCLDHDLDATIQQFHKNKSSSSQLLINSSSFSLAENTVANKLFHAQSSSPLPLIDSPSFSVSETPTTDKLSPDLFGSQKAKSVATSQEMFPPGMVFDPSDEVLVSHYLKGKVSGCSDGGGFQYIRDIELYEHEPTVLSRLAYDSGHNKMYFFTRRKLRGRHVDRQAGGGFWKRTGNSLNVKDTDGNPIATKTTLVYYLKTHKSSMSLKTQWVMKEYVLLESQLPNENEEESESLTPWTLCVLFRLNRERNDVYNKYL